MGRFGFFLIQVDGSGELPASRGLEPTTVHGPDHRLPRQGFDLRLEWVDGEPHVTALGGVRDVQRNDVTIPTGTPVALQSGDTITIGRARLIWQEPGDLEAQVLEQPDPSYRVLIKSPQGSREISLPDADLRVGRAPDNDIFIDDERISRYHAQLIRRAHGYEIVDLGSVNGLRHQGRRIVRKILVDGDEVWLSSDVSLTYRVDQPAPSSPNLTQKVVRPPHVQPVDEAPIVAREDVDWFPSDASEETVVRPLPTSGPSDVGKPGRGREAEKDRSVTIGHGTDQTVVRPSDAAPRESGLAQVDGPSRETPGDATVVIPKPEEQSVQDPPADATVVASQKAFDRTEPSQEGGVDGQESGDPPKDLVADQTMLAPKRSDPADGLVDATVVRPAVVTPEEPTRMQVVRPEPEKTKEPPADAAGETAMVNMAQFVGDTSIAAVSGTIIRDTQIPHLVVHLPTRTWEVQFSKANMSVGRDINCDIHIPDESVSRRHANIERHGDDFVIREAHSRNGLWLNQGRIEKRTLRDGDVVSVGRAKLIFKGGFAADDLTLIGRPRAAGKPVRRPVVFVPGFGGSELWLGGERLWPNPKVIISNPEIYRLPGDPRIEARHIVSDVMIVPNIIKQQQYSRLGDYLETGLGYKRGRDLLEFAYDWRHDIRLASQRLAETIEGWGVQPPVTIIAHSLGTLVTRYYVERLGGKKVVDRIVLLGGPHYGTPKGLSIILDGPGILPFGMGDERMRHVIASLPSAYQILPVYRCVTDQDDVYIDPLRDESWLPERQRPFLRAARSFRNELGVLSSVPSVSIFGYGLKTILRVKIHRRFDGQWEKVDFVEDTAGDLSVPSGSAVLKGSEIHPVLQEHGSLYVDDDVKMRLKVELTRSTTWEKGI